MISYTDVRVFPYWKPWVGGVDYLGRTNELRVKRGANVTKYIDEFSDFKKRDDELERVNGRFLYAGPFYNHFGHFMTDSIIRLHGYEPELHDGVIFPCVMRGFKGKIPDYLYDVLDIFGIKKSKVFFVTSPSLVKRLDVVERSSWLMSQDYADWYWPILKEIAEKTKKTGSQICDQFDGKSLFLGRSHLKGQGSVFGERYIKHFLESNGFEYFCPENYSVIDQANILLKAKKIVFIEGSSIYSTELLDSLSASCFMISRRSNGAQVFKRQLKKFSKFIFSCSTNVGRLKNNNDGYASTSPSFIKDVSLFATELCDFLSVDTDGFCEDSFWVSEFSEINEYYKKREILFGALSEVYMIRCNS